MALTLGGWLDDRLLELNDVFFAIVRHVRTKYHVLVEVTGEQKGCRKILRSDVIIDLVLACVKMIQHFRSR